MASSDNFESKVAEIGSFTKQIFSGEKGLKKTKLLETLKDIVAEQENKSKPKCKKRRISEVISELEDNESVKIQKKGRHYIIMPKKNTVEKHDVDLLDELWRKIFTYLPTKTILGKVAKVCKRFHRIASDPTLIRHVNLVNIDKQYDQQHVLNSIGRYKCLNTLKVANCKEQNELVSCALKSNPNLKTLVLHSNNMFGVGMRSRGRHVIRFDADLAKTICTYGRKIENLIIKMATTKEAIEEISTLENIKRLDILNPYRNIILAKHFVAFGENFKKLEVLNVKFDGGKIDVDAHLNNILRNQQAALNALQNPAQNAANANGNANANANANDNANGNNANNGQGNAQDVQVHVVQPMELEMVADMVMGFGGLDVFVDGNPNANQGQAQNGQNDANNQDNQNDANNQ